ncbi:MAG: hypothetical protein ACI9SC_000639 [Gammaproteobacteria bacterium]|jgi:hypothetical protein
MTENQSDDILIENIHSKLDASLLDIDAATQSKITQARHRALDQQANVRSIKFWLPAGAVATACIALVMLSLVSKTTIDETTPIDDFELISNIDDLELLEELEFYEWLEEYELPT